VDLIKIIMNLLLEIKDNKVAFFMEMLNHFSFVKATPLSDSKAEYFRGFKEAVEEVKLAKEGKLKTTPLKDFLDEL
jgi:hypothetical protein